ncbi:MAG: DNA polymerase IV [Bacilli bacterium]
MQQSINYRIIFHIDMNSFYASCEQANNKDLIGKPVVVAHNDVFRKSIILTASYEARKYGIKTTMMVRDAIKLCNDLIVIEPNFELYQHYSQVFFDYLRTISNKLEVTSIDEGYMDLTDVCQKVNALELANTIQQTLLNKYQLPCSIGIAPNKFLAKMASDMKKPLGITVLRKREIESLLWPLPIGSMYGVGKKTAPRLQEIGIHTIGDIHGVNHDKLREVVGKSMLEYLLNRSKGIDDSEVDYYSFDSVSSISNSHTFDYNLLNVKTMKDTLKVLNNSVSARLTSKNLVANTIGIQIKYGDFKLINRSKGLVQPINDSLEMWNIVEELFDEHYDWVSEVRLVGVFATRLSDESSDLKQISIFDDFDKLNKEEHVSNVLNKINEMYKNKIINIGINNKKGE